MLSSSPLLLSSDAASLLLYFETTPCSHASCAGDCYMLSFLRDLGVRSGRCSKDGQSANFAVDANFELGPPLLIYKSEYSLEILSSVLHRTRVDSMLS